MQLIRGEVLLYRWDGTGFTRRLGDPPATSLSFAYQGGVLTLRISRSELGNTRGFTFLVVAIGGVVFDPVTGEPDPDTGEVDVAPGGGSGLYSLPGEDHTADARRAEPQADACSSRGRADVHASAHRGALGHERSHSERARGLRRTRRERASSRPGSARHREGGGLHVEHSGERGREELPRFGRRHVRRPSGCAGLHGESPVAPPPVRRLSFFAFLLVAVAVTRISRRFDRSHAARDHRASDTESTAGAQPRRGSAAGRKPRTCDRHARGPAVGGGRVVRTASRRARAERAARLEHRLLAHVPEPPRVGAGARRREHPRGDSGGGRLSPLPAARQRARSPSALRATARPSASRGRRARVPELYVPARPQQGPRCARRAGVRRADGRAGRGREGRRRRRRRRPGSTRSSIRPASRTRPGSRRGSRARRRRR